MAPSTPAGETRRDIGFTLFVALLALSPRLYVAIAWPREPVWDGHYYDFGAKRIAEGFGYSDDISVGAQTVWHPWCHYPVGYSAFLGAIYTVFGSGPHVATIANALVGALLVAVVHRLALYATPSVVRARLAALLVALSPGLIVYSALLMTEPLAAFGILSSAWLFVRGMGVSPTSTSAEPSRRIALRGTYLATLASGAALGFTTLVRPQSLSCVPAFALLALAYEPSPRWAIRVRSAVLRAAGVGAVALAVVAPWTIRNCRVMDGCALVSTNTGWNLAIGAFPRATGRFETLRAGDGCPIVTGQVKQDRCWMNLGIHHILANPRRWIGLMPAKLSYTFDHESFPMGYLGEADPAAWPAALQARGREFLSTVHRVMLGLASLSVVSWPFVRRMGRYARLVQCALLATVLALTLRALVSDHHPAWPLALFIPVVAFSPLPGAPRRGGVIAYLCFTVASVVAAHAVFFGEDRYHMVVAPVFCILAACSLRFRDDSSVQVSSGLRTQRNPSPGTS